MNIKGMATAVAIANDAPFGRDPLADYAWRERGLGVATPLTWAQKRVDAAADHAGQGRAATDGRAAVLDHAPTCAGPGRRDPGDREAGRQEGAAMKLTPCLASRSVSAHRWRICGHCMQTSALEDASRQVRDRALRPQLWVSDLQKELFGNAVDEYAGDGSAMTRFQSGCLGAAVLCWACWLVGGAADAARRLARLRLPRCRGHLVLPHGAAGGGGPVHAAGHARRGRRVPGRGAAAFGVAVMHQRISGKVWRSQSPISRRTGPSLSIRKAGLLGAAEVAVGSVAVVEDLDPDTLELAHYPIGLLDFVKPAEPVACLSQTVAAIAKPFAVCLAGSDHRDVMFRARTPRSIGQPR